MNEDKIKEAFVNVKKDISEINNKINELHATARNNACSISKINLILDKLLHATARTTARTTARSTARNRLKQSEKTIIKGLDTIKLKKAIQDYINQRYSTSIIKEEIMFRFHIKERCFYKYLKLTRELIKPKSQEQSEQFVH